MVNVGSLDRAVRIVLGLVLLAAPFVSPAADALTGWGAWRFAVPVAGLIFLGTAAFRVCPLYRLVGIRTCRLS